MSHPFTFYTVLAILGCLGTGVLCAWLLYGQSNVLTVSLSRTLAVIRATTVSLILWLLFSPLIRQVAYELERPVIVIAQDNSLSLGSAQGLSFDYDAYSNAMMRMKAKLAESYDIRTYSFGERITDGLLFTYSDRFTNISMLSAMLKDEMLNRNVGAVVIASDGAFNRGGSPGADLAELKAPVYTIALGDTIPKKDLLLAKVFHNDIVNQDNDFRIELLLQAHQCAGQSSKLSVTEGGRVLHEEIVKIDETEYSRNRSILVKAGAAGIHQYTISLSPVQDESSLVNNRSSFVINVIDQKSKTLIAGSSPHPDLSALRSAMSKDKRYDVSVVTGNQLDTTNPFDYGLIVLHQIPGNTQHSGFTDKVSRSKVPLWYIVGEQTAADKLNQIQTAVRFTRHGNGLEYVSNKVEDNLSAFELDKSSRNSIEQFDPLLSPVLKMKTTGDIYPIINQIRGKIDSSEPLLFFTEDKGRKLGFLLGEGLWKWKLSEASKDRSVPVFTLLTNKIVQYLTTANNHKQFVVHPARQAFDENERVMINATLYNDSYVPLNTPEVTIQLKNAQNRVYQFNFSRYGDAYRLDAGILPPGYYTYTARTSLGPKKYMEQGAIFINPLIAEYQQLANHQILHRLAEQNAGKMYSPDQLKSLTEKLLNDKSIKTLSYENRRYEELVDFRWISGLILFFLTMEWFLRKRNGLI